MALLLAAALTAQAQAQAQPTAAGGPSAVAAAGTVTGVVLDSTGGAPIARVAVRLQSTGASAVTGDDGRFSLGRVPAGAHELYVSAVDFILVRKRIVVSADATTDVIIVLTEGTGAYTESLDVTAPAAAPAGVPPVEGRIRGIELLQLSGGMANDPLRAVQALPGVIASDDFRSEFAVRGAGPRQIGFVFEGLQTPVLLHTVQQVQDAGSIAMVSGQVLEEISLRNGSYAQRYGNRTGAELEFRMREGTRERFRAHAMTSLIDASGVMEGPIGRDGRGSWIASIRRSYMDLLLKRVFDDQRVSFGFYDAQVKLAYDASKANRIEFAVTGGRSHLDLQVDEVRNPNGLETADSDGAVAVATWRLTPSPAWSLTQRVGYTLNQYENRALSGPTLDAGRSRDAIYRAEWLAMPHRRLSLEAGGESRWSTGRAEEQRLSGGLLQLRENYRAGTSTQSAYGGLTIGATRALAVSPGVRIDRWGLIDTVSASPWLTARWQWPGQLALRAGTGLYQQPPGFTEVLGLRGNRRLRPERAVHRDIGLEGRLPGGFAWTVTGYWRTDTDMLRRINSEVRVVNGRVVFASTASPQYFNLLGGTSRGIEWVFERRSRNGVSGWLTYAYGRTRYTDATTGERFWGDYDQRHTFSAFATYRTSDRMSVGLRFRAGSNLPATGYWTERAGRQYVTDVRNTLRVPDYSRLDVRLDRTFTWTEKRLTLFVDLLNATRRDNVRYLPPSVNRTTFEASGMFESLVPMVPSVGLLLEF